MLKEGGSFTMKAVQIVKQDELREIDVEQPVIDGKNNVLVQLCIRDRR